MGFSAKKFVTSSVDVSNFNPLCKAVGDALRVEILKVLQDNSFGVLELCSIFEIGQPAMSHHLKVLWKSHLVSTKRDGANIFYRRNNFNPEENFCFLRGNQTSPRMWVNRETLEQIRNGIPNFPAHVG